MVICDLSAQDKDRSIATFESHTKHVNVSELKSNIDKEKIQTYQ